MISILVGLVFIVAGALGIVRWFPDVIGVVRGFLPLSLILGGLVAVVTGIGSLSGRRRSNARKAE